MRLLCLVIVASFSISLVSSKDNLTVLCLVVSYLKTFLYLGLFLLRCFPSLIHQPSNPQIKKNEMVFFIFVGCLVFIYLFFLKLHSIVFSVSFSPLCAWVFPSESLFWLPHLRFLLRVKIPEMEPGLL